MGAGKVSAKSGQFDQIAGGLVRGFTALLSLTNWSTNPA